MKIKSLLKKLLMTILVLIIVFIGYKQYQVETYMIKQKEIYHILEGRKRVNYFPFVIRFLNGELNETQNYQAESEAFYMPYAIVKLKSVYSDKDFDSYMVYCYFTKEEIDRYNVNNKKDFRKGR